MFGIQIRARGKSKSQLIKILKEAVGEIENNHTSVYIPLNDEDNTDCDLNVCNIGDMNFCDNWRECPTVTYEEWAGEDSNGKENT